MELCMAWPVLSAAMPVLGIVCIGVIALCLLRSIVVNNDGSVEELSEVIVHQTTSDTNTANFAGADHIIRVQVCDEMRSTESPALLGVDGSYTETSMPMSGVVHGGSAAQRRGAHCHALFDRGAAYRVNIVPAANTTAFVSWMPLSARAQAPASTAQSSLRKSSKWQIQMFVTPSPRTHIYLLTIGITLNGVRSDQWKHDAKATTARIKGMGRWHDVYLSTDERSSGEALFYGIMRFLSGTLSHSRWVGGHPLVFWALGSLLIGCVHVNLTCLLLNKNQP
jgi:hypothetical protein